MQCIHFSIWLLSFDIIYLVAVFLIIMRRANSLGKTLMRGKTEGKGRKGRQRMRWLNSITDSMDMNLRKLRDSEGQESLMGCSPWGRKESGMTQRLNSNNNLAVVYSVSLLCNILLHRYSKVCLKYSNVDRRLVDSRF